MDASDPPRRWRAPPGGAWADAGEDGSPAVATAWYQTPWVRVGAGILLFGLLAAAAVPVLVPVDRVRPRLIQALEAEIGRPVRIDALRLHVIPSVYLEAVNVSIGNPRGFPTGDTVTAKSVGLRLGLRSLLARKLDVTSMTLSGVRVNLLQDTAGRTNLELHVTGGLLTLRHVGAVAVTNAEIALAGFDARTGQVTPLLTVTGVSASIRPIDLTRPDPGNQFDTTVVLRGVRVTTPFLAAPLQFEQGTVAVKDGAARGTFAAVLGTMRVTGTVAIAGFEPLSVVTFEAAIPDLDAAGMNRLVVRGAAGGLPAAPVRRLVARGTVTIGRFRLSPLEATRVRARVRVYTDAVRVSSYGFYAYGGTVRGAASLDDVAAGLPMTATATVRGLDVAQAVRALSPSPSTIKGSFDADLQAGDRRRAGSRDGADRYRDVCRARWLVPAARP